MIILRKYFSDIDEEQREFANKHNKELKRKWQMQKGYDKTMKLYPDLSKKEQNRYISAKNSKTLPGDGSKGYEAMNKEARKIAYRQEMLLDRGRGTTINGVEVRENTQRRRGEKKVRGVKQTIEHTPETIAKRKQELMKKANNKGVTRSQIAERIAKRKEAEAQKLAQTTANLPVPVKQTTQNTAKSAVKNELVKVVNPAITANNNVKQGMAKRAMGWVKRNPKLTAGIGLGATALGTAGILGYRHYKKNKEN